jgi:hypothetical protein
MAGDNTEAAIIVIILLGKHVLQLVMNNVMQRSHLAKYEQQH